MIYTLRLKKVLSGVLLAVMLILAADFTRTTGSSEVFFGTKRRIPIYCVERPEKCIALTFDAAYGADKTSKIMDVLSEKGVPATFFLVGFWVRNYPEKAREIAQRGYEIGTHSNVHGHMGKMTSQEITSDLSASIDRIVEATGVKPTLFRAPYGEYNDRLISEAEKLGLATIQWSVDSLDWKNVSVQSIVERVKVKAHSGAIILMHNNSDYVVDSLPQIIDYLLKEGYTFCTVGQLIYRENYYVDNSGRQHLKN